MDYKKDLLSKLPELKNIDGYPIGKDEDIIALSQPPYYTACPNPYIEDFIKEHGTPYNEETDDYRREPFVADVSEGKGHPIYNVHTYHTKVPHKAIIPFIEHYTNEGDIVLDAFCGTGMTGVATQECNRNAILSDLSPMASFIAFNYNNPIDILSFKYKASKILEDTFDECGWMYETLHSDGTTKGTINYTVWSDVFISPFSGNEFVFYDVAVDKETGKVKDSFLCPDTGATLTKKQCEKAMSVIYDPILQTEIEIIKQVPVLINYNISVFRNRKKSSQTFVKSLDEFDLETIRKIDEAKIPYWFPTDRMMDGKEARRNDKVGITHIHHFFYKRCLWVMSSIFNKCNEPIMKIWFTSQIVNISKLNRYRPTISFPYNPLSGTLYIGSQVSEPNVFQAYINKLKKFENAISSITKHNFVSIVSATNLNIENNSIDYIFTDPPFGDNLSYSELNFIWECWLKVITNIEKEGIINASQSKYLKEYNDLMYASFREYYRVLKPKRWITVVFHNSKSSVWNGIQDAITKAGFLISQVTTLDKQQGSFKQVTAPGAVANDLVISAFKPSNKFDTHFAKSAGESMEVLFIDEFLSNLPITPKIERTDKMLYSKMIAYYIQRGYEIRHDAKSFYSLLHSNFIQEDGFWFTASQINSYLEYKKQQKLEGIDEVKSGEMFLFVTDEKSALVWLYNFLSVPKTFSDISVAFNQTANIQGDNVPDLRELLEQNFIFENAKYRRPLSEPEHNQLVEKRERLLMREFETLLIQAQTERKKIKEVRKEALVFGFETCYKNKRYQDILTVAGKLDKSILENSGELNDFVQAAEIMIAGIQ